MLGKNKNLTSQLSSPSATNKTLGPRSKVDSATAKKSETDNLKILQQKMHSDNRRKSMSNPRVDPNLSVTKAFSIQQQQ